MSSTLSLSSVARVESKVHPGVIFVTRKMTDRFRLALNLKLAAIQPRLDHLVNQIQALGPVPFDPDTLLEGQSLTAEQQEANKLWEAETTPLLARYADLLNNEVYPRQVECGLAKVLGLEVEDAEGDMQKITGANAAELLPIDLYFEAIAVVREAAGLGPKREGNSESPTTSSAVVDGRTPDTTA